MITKFVAKELPIKKFTRKKDKREYYLAEDAEAIHLGLQQLPVFQKEVLTLFFLEEFSLEEISSITGVSNIQYIILEP